MEGLPSVGALAIDPQVTSTIYAGDRGSRVFKSTNGGKSWSQSSNGLPGRDIVALAVHPDAPAIVFAGTYGGGVYRSIDGGASWSPMNDQPPNLLIRALAIDAGSSTLFAGTAGVVKGWTGCDSDTGPGRTSTCTVSMVAARSVSVRMVGAPQMPPGRAKHVER